MIHQIANGTATTFGLGYEPWLPFYGFDIFIIALLALASIILLVTYLGYRNDLREGVDPDPNALEVALFLGYLCVASIGALIPNLAIYMLTGWVLPILYLFTWVVGASVITAYVKFYVEGAD